MHAVQLNGYWIDRREVSCGEYAAWLNRAHRDGVVNVRPYQDSSGKTADHVYFQQTPIFNLSQEHQTPCIAWDGHGSFVVRPDRNEHPVTTVTWEGAALYCQAQRKRLPTEAEWEFAAKGSEGRRFPWGNEWPTCERALLARGPRWNSCGAEGLRPRGGMAGDRTPLGILDLGGSVMEWVTDVFAPTYDVEGGGLISKSGGPVLNPSYAGETLGGVQVRRVARGGSWANEISAARTTARWAIRPDTTDAYLGFRCARSPSE